MKNKKKTIVSLLFLAIVIGFCIYRSINLTLVWQGITIKDINMDLKANVPSNAIKINQPETTSEFLMKSNIFSIPILFIVIITIFIMKKKFDLNKKELKQGIVLGVILGFICILLHEFIHAIFYPDGSIVNIGIVLNPFYAYATSIDCISRNSFILMSIMPFFILGVIPFGIFIYYFSKNSKVAGILLGFCIMGLIGGTPDLYNIYNMEKQIPNDAIIINSENLTYWYK